MTIPTVTRLLFIYVFMVAVSATVTAITTGYQPAREVYVFLLRSTMLWAGLVWVSVSIYIVLISEADDFVVESWISFVIGALMIYLGMSGTFAATVWWLGVRTILYLLLSISAVLMFNEIKRVGGLAEPSDRLAAVLSRRKLNQAFDREFWKRRR